MCRNTSLKVFSVPKPPHQLTQGNARIKTSCHLCSLNTNTVYLQKEIISQRNNLCQYQQYAMGKERIQYQICTSNKARNVHQWFSTICISHPSAAETPANLRLDYIPDRRRKSIARNGRTYVLLKPAVEHVSHNILAFKQPCSCLLHRWVTTQKHHILVA
jgi:hypothetical protein